MVILAGFLRVCCKALTPRLCLMSHPNKSERKPRGLPTVKAKQNTVIDETVFSHHISAPIEVH